MPFPAILPNGPASNTSGGIHVSGPVTAGVVSGAGGAGSAAAAEAAAASGVPGAAGAAVEAATVVAPVWAIAVPAVARAAAATNVICRMNDERGFIPSDQLSPPICKVVG